MYTSHRAASRPESPVYVAGANYFGCAVDLLTTSRTRNRTITPGKKRRRMGSRSSEAGVPYPYQSDPRTLFEAPASTSRPASQEAFTSGQSPLSLRPASAGSQNNIKSQAMQFRKNGILTNILTNGFFCGIVSYITKVQA
jgi:hypothetical protein